MEWVEVTGKTVEEAKETALDQLGVDHTDAEFEVLEVPKGGLFGRLRSEARVRARVLPTAPRPKVERRERRRQGGQRERGSGRQSARPGEGQGALQGERQGQRQGARQGERTGRGAPRPARPAATRSEGANMTTSDVSTVDGTEVAENFLGGLVDVFGRTYTIERRDLDEDVTEVAVEGDDLGLLIGQRGQTLSAVQELARTVVQRKAPGHHGRLMIDIAGYRRARRDALERFTRQVAERVVTDSVAKVLEPMPAADRKVIHDTINTIEGVSTTSEGEEPHRHVVILPDVASS